MTGVIYARYSSDKQTENSILGQVRECKQFAEREGITVIDIYKDEAISGRTAEKRPAFMKMIKDAAMHFFDYVIVWKGDRFSRSRADAAKYKSELKKFGVKVLSATEANCTGAEAILMDGINEALAEYYSVELATKVERGMTQNAIDGKFNGGILPLGYVKEGKGVRIEEDEAKIVRELFDLIANKQMSQREVVSLFKQKGYKAKNGKDLTKSSLNRMIHCEKYYGHYEFKGTVNDNIYPPIISKELFETAVSKCRVNHANRASYKTREMYLLSGKLACGNCLQYMTGSTSTGRHGDIHHYYRCKTSLNECPTKYIIKNDIENSVLEATIDYIFTTEHFKEMTSALIKKTKECLPDLELYEKKLIDIDKKIEHFMEIDALNGGLEIVAKKLKELQRERDEQIQAINDYKRLNSIFTEEHVINFFKQLKIKDYISTSDKKYLIDKLVYRVYYFNEQNIRIYFKYPTCSGINGDSNGVRLMEREVHQFTK